MTKDEILSKAVFVVFPMFAGEAGMQNKVDVELLDLAKRRFPNNKVYVLKPAENDMYRGWHLNEHHYTTKYHLRNLLPVFASAFGVNFRKEDWRYKRNLALDNGRLYDLGTIEPKQENKYKITCQTLNVSVESTDLTWHDGYPLVSDCKTEYHKMYAFTHCVSKVEHIAGGSNGKSILVLCDSQMVPSIPLLCAFYKEVFVFDNRFGIKTKEIYENKNFDDVLICLWRDCRYNLAKQRINDIISNSFVE